MPIIECRSLTLKIEFSPDLQLGRADSALLRRVIANLLENAIKSTPEGGNIHIAATMTDGEIQIAFIDGGRPIPPELHDVIFDRHRRDEIREKGGRAGMGLGLAFCRLAINAMHGRIWVANPRNTGGAFYFSLPTNGT
jgi:K+-sensing histidine kinase KdpD